MAVFRFFGAMATQLAAEELRPYLVAMLNPLHRAVTAGARVVMANEKDDGASPLRCLRTRS
jgi:hypothetical protein